MKNSTTFILAVSLSISFSGAVMARYAPTPTKVSIGDVVVQPPHDPVAACHCYNNVTNAVTPVLHTIGGISSSGSGTYCPTGTHMVCS